MRLSCARRHASATVIDVPIENAQNMHFVWMAWFQFCRKQDHLRIDVLFFRNILNEQRSSATFSGFNCLG